MAYTCLPFPLESCARSRAGDVLWGEVCFNGGGLGRTAAVIWVFAREVVASVVTALQVTLVECKLVEAIVVTTSCPEQVARGIGAVLNFHDCTLR